MQPHFPFEQRYPSFNKRPLELADAEQICEREGITLGYRKLNCHGLYLRVHDVPTIFIEERLGPRQRTFALLHELGHHFLHRNLDRMHLKDIFFPYVEIEQQANDVALIGVAPHPVLERLYRQHRLTPAQLLRKLPIFAELGPLTDNPQVHPLVFLNRRIELFHQQRLHPELDFLSALKVRARGLTTRHRRSIRREQVRRGMTEVDAILHWGEPEQVLHRRRGRQVQAKWIYRKVDEDGEDVRQKVYFKDGVLVGATL